MQRLETLGDAELLERTARQPEAFAVFYRRHIDRLLAYFRRRVDSAELALDLAAETFARALEAAERFQAGSAPAEAWLFSIARNLLTDSYRHGRVEDAARLRLGMEPLSFTDDGLAAVEARTVELEAALPRDQAQAVRARVIEGRSYDELAADLGCSPQVVRQRVSRGLRALREEMEDR